MLQKKILLFILTIFFMNCTHKEKRKINNEPIKEEEKATKNHKTKGKLYCDNKYINLRDIKRNTLIEQDFVFYNTGKESVELLKYETSCNCTELTISKNIIQPKDSVFIKMVVETKGKKLKNHFVTSTIKTNGETTFYQISVKFNLVEK